MRSILLPRHGPPEVFEERHLESLHPGPGQVVVRTAAAGVNFADILQRLGLYANAPKPPYVPGFEVAGTVQAIEPEEPAGPIRASAPGIGVGDRVVAMMPRGGYADEVLVDASRVFPLPESIDFEAAAALPVNYLTAWICMYTMGNLQADETVLVHGGAGGVGSAALQLARRTGSRIVATAGSGAKLQFLRSAGADLALDYRDPSWDARIREQLGARPIDLILDPVGGEMMRRGARLLAPLGRLISYGLSEAVAGPRRNWWRAFRAWRATPRFNPIDLIGRNTGVFGFHLALLRGKEHKVEEALRQLVSLVAAGEITPVVDSRFPLTAAGAAAAHRHIHERRNIGKVLLVPERD